MRPSTSSLGSEVRGSTGLTVARINSRQIDTSVTVKDRQTVVLGGLITTREAEVTSKVPFLGDIPLLGSVFEHETTSMEKVDLAVFLTVVHRARERTDRGAAGPLRSPVARRDHGGPDDDPRGAELEYSSSGPQF